MKFDSNQSKRRLMRAVLGALLMSLLLCVSMASAQEAPRPEGSSPIKPPMIKPPMGKTQGGKSGSVRSTSRRRKAVRRKRSAKKRTVRHEIVITPAEGEQPNAEPPGGGGTGGMSGGAPGIKPPMANESNAPLTAPPRPTAPISGGILNGKAVMLPRPAYPPIARSARASGTVVVDITIDEEGNVVSARAVSGHPLLQSAAVAAAREAKFTPTRIDGQPVKVSGQLTYNFVL